MPFLERLGPRAARRPLPRLTIALAAAGCALAVVGALVVGGDRLGGDEGDDGSQLPGILLTAAVVAVGFALLARARTGPLATAGAVAAALGVPPLLFFLTFDEGSFPPYSTDTILFVSTAVWAVSFAAGPGRGRPLFLGAAAIGLWMAILQATESVFDFPFGLFDLAAARALDDTGFETEFEPDTPDLRNIGILSLAFAAAYLVLARRWDRRGFAGAATPLTAAALVIIPVGLLTLANELEALGTGLLTTVVGAAVAAHGASVGRRATTWLGAVGVAFGVLTVVGELVEEATPGGLVLMAVGAGLVVAADAIRRATGEPDEVAVAQPHGPAINPEEPPTAHWRSTLE